MSDVPPVGPVTSGMAEIPVLRPGEYFAILREDDNVIQAWVVDEDGVPQPRATGDRRKVDRG